jgi:uncharacterized protein YkwD
MLPLLRAGLALWLAAGAYAQPAAQQFDELTAVLSAARSRGCEGRPGAERRLLPVRQLSEAAQRIAAGEPHRDAAKRSGYRATRLFVGTMTGHRTAAAVASTMATKYCKALTDPSLTDVGLHRQGDAYWIVLAAPFAPPPPAAAADVAARILALTNEARSRPRKCGARMFEAAAPVAPNPLLDRAAAIHAGDMAQHSYLEHEGRDAASPADRVDRAGYRWRSVGENIASGQTTPEEVVQEWLASPTHCATLMNPGFTHMGVAYAVDVNSEAGIYWAQVFGRPGSAR